MSSTRDLLEFRDTLPAEERSRLEARILYAHETLLAEAQQAARIAKLPLLPPDAVKKREWVKKRTHAKARCERCRNSWPSPRGEGTRGVPLARQTRLRESVSRSPCYPPCLAAVLLPTCWDYPRLQKEWGEVEGKRKRKIREAYYEARTARLLLLGYSQ
jgi:hypothetical protein